MPFFDTGLKTLIIGGLLFFGIFSYVCLLWTDRDPKEKQNIMTGVIVSCLYSFKVFFIGTIILIIVYFII